MEMSEAEKAMTTEYVQLSGYIPVRWAVKTVRHDPSWEKDAEEFQSMKLF